MVKSYLAELHAMHMCSHRCHRVLADYFGGVPFPIRGREIKTRFITNNYLSTSLIFSAINSTKQASWRRDRNIRCLSSSINDDKGIVYFHISPSGDWWTGPSIFAAKHLQPDYVKSIPIPAGFDPNLYFGEEGDDNDEEDDFFKQNRIEGANENDIQSKVSCKIEKGTEQSSSTNTSSTLHKHKLSMSWEEKQELLFQIYDEGKIPTDLIDD